MAVQKCLSGYIKERRLHNPLSILCPLPQIPIPIPKLSVRFRPTLAIRSWPDGGWRTARLRPRGGLGWLCLTRTSKASPVATAQQAATNPVNIPRSPNRLHTPGATHEVSFRLCAKRCRDLAATRTGDGLWRRNRSTPSLTLRPLEPYGQPGKCCGSDGGHGPQLPGHSPRASPGSDAQSLGQA